MQAPEITVYSRTFSPLRKQNAFQLVAWMVLLFLVSVEPLKADAPEPSGSEAGHVHSDKSSAVDGAASSSSDVSAATNSATSGLYSGPTLSDFDLARYQYCGKDDDCVVSVNGCCNCENGAKEVAVNRARLEAFRQRFACEKVACGDILTSPTCGAGVVSCIEHRCRYIPEEENL